MEFENISYCRLKRSNSNFSQTFTRSVSYILVSFHTWTIRVGLSSYHTEARGETCLNWKQVSSRFPRIAQPSNSICNRLPLAPSGKMFGELQQTQQLYGVRPSSASLPHRVRGAAPRRSLLVLGRSRNARQSRHRRERLFRLLSRRSAELQELARPPSQRPDAQAPLCVQQTLIAH